MSLRRPLATALGAAVDWLVEPPDEGVPPALAVVAEPAPAPAPVPIRPRSVVAIAGVRRGVGATTVARALAVELARRDAGGVCVVTASRAVRRALATPAATRMARSLAQGTPARPAGRLTFVESTDVAGLALASRAFAPLVIDAADPEQARLAAACADVVVLVADPDVEPALAELVSRSLAHVGPDPIVALARVRTQDEAWSGRADVELPLSRTAAKLAGAGRDSRGGAFARAVRELADHA